jgi:tetratricopeptide (TPR) repeat protein
MAIPLAVLALVAFLPALNNGFVNLDDQANFLSNPFYRGLGRGQIAWAWTTDWLGVYQPLAWMLFEIQYVASGLDPRGYHLTSLLLHGLTAVALYALTLALIARASPQLLARTPTGVVLGSAFAVALFVVHPLRVEVVAWASCQPYLPCAAVAVLAVFFYLGLADAAPPHRALGLLGVWILFGVALLFKAAAVSLPAVLLLLDYYPLQRLGGGPGRWFGPSARRVWAEKVPFFALSLIFAALAVYAKRSTLARLEQHGPLSRIAQACYGACFHLAKTIWPTHLCAYYPVPNPFDWRAPTYLACAALVVGVSVTLFQLRRRHRGPLTAWLAYLAILAPVSGLVTNSSQITADRYCYLASMSGVPLLATAIAQLTRPGRGRAPIILGVSVAGLGLLVGSSWMLCRSWRDTMALASHALDQGWRDPEILLGLGWGQEERGDIAGAENSFCDALRLNPFHVPSLVALGRVRYQQGRFGNAAGLLTEAARLQPGMPEIHNNLGTALAAQNRHDHAIAQFTEALRLRPDFDEARKNLALVLRRVRRDGP